MQSNKRILIFPIILIVSFVLDRVSKIYILDFFLKNSFNSYYLNKYLNFVLIWNKGVAFGILSSEDFLYNVITLIIFLIIFFLIFLIYKSNKLIEIIGFSLVVGGAVGNLFDRLYYSAVPDFLDLHYGNFHWFVFNVADIFVSLGVGLILIFDIFKFKIEDENRNEKKK